MSQYRRTLAAFVLGAALFTTVPVWGQDLNTLLVNFLSDLRSGTLGITQAISTITFSATSATVPPKMLVSTFPVFYLANGGGGSGVWENTFVGYKAGNAFGATSTGYANVAIGKDAGLVLNGNSTDATGNVFVGYAAGTAATTGSNNTIVGTAAGATQTTATLNTFLGYHAGQSITGGSNTYLGNQAGVGTGTTSGTGNTAVGSESLNDVSTAVSNTALGASALESATTGGTNTAAGAFGLRNNLTGAGNVSLGYFAGAYETASNAFYVDNQNRTDTAGDKAKALLYGVFNAAAASQELTVNATLHASGRFNYSTQQAVTVDSATTFAITSSYVVLACTGAETINTITGGAAGMMLIIEHTDTECTFADDDAATASNAIDLTGTATSDVGAVNKMIWLIHNGSYWMEVAESDN